MAVPRWAPAVRFEAEAGLRAALDGVGDPTRERLFRMNVTLCLHRAATDAEVAGQPDWFLTHPACGLAGGPVEVLWENTPGADSTKPCRSPRKMVLPGVKDPLLWIPQDCGRCKSCRARATFKVPQ
jgi:hypothetical protein